ncbi:DeoR/GlpR family DNA-binding transcription regulator [Telmatospirillum sp.]|uniref:DeoR/GlpR family DNA-binding transcription regulator n=1 Tax=Telmatospirillum sp. TaxID=2079197 RepID=UPI0028409A8A|nr:DeoR/GlpR family DNA-binding transcription regulator [Telmatospirillum sp.]MDR3440673.1 DeoR/GlpR family DNA-binding transcription regulator [Telmatospirillum sp.]
MMSSAKDLTSRQRHIVAWIEDQGYATIEALADHLGVSMQTVRREIIRLDASGHLQRFHGGAGLPEGRIRLGYAGKSALARDAKERIGTATASRIADGAAVFLDVGTTVEAVARALLGRKGLQIITNSFNCARVFQGLPSCSAFVLGGSLRGADGSLVGDTTLSTLRQFKVDVAVIGCSAIEGDGSVMDYDVDKIAVKRLAIAAARQTLLVADGMKFRHHAVARIATLDEFTALVTDAPLPTDIESHLGECQPIVATNS